MWSRVTLSNHCMLSLDEAIRLHLVPRQADVSRDAYSRVAGVETGGCRDGLGNNCRRMGSDLPKEAIAEAV